METNKWLLLFYWMTGIHCMNYTRFLEDNLATTCPYTTFCTVGPSKPFSRRKYYTPCCRDCSCEPDCAEQGRCCPDYPAIDAISQSFLACSVPSLSVGEMFNMEMLNGRNFGIAFYYTIKTCPVGYDNQAIIANCLNPNSINLNEHRIVSDKNGRVFQNLNCAKCNGVDTVTSWMIQIVCTETWNPLVSLQNWTDLLALEHCIVAFVPPDKPTFTSVISSRCLEADYSTCNATGYWRIYDDNIKRACESTGSTYFYTHDVPHYNKHYVYKNVFCFLCNKNEFDPKIDVCEADEYYRLSKGIGGKKIFTTILDASLTESFGKKRLPNNGVTRSSKCSAAEIHDWHFDKCRALRCPAVQVPVDGKCVDLYKDFSGYLLSFDIIGKHPNITDIVDTSRKANTLGEAISDQVYKQIDFNGKACQVCPAQLFVTKNGTVLANMIRTTDRCQPFTIMMELHKWSNQPQSITIFNRTIELELYLHTESGQPSYMSRFSIATNIHTSNIGCPVLRENLQELFYCSFIEIPAEEYNQMLSRPSTKIDMNDFKSVQSRNDLYTNATYRICVDKYLPSARSQCVSSIYVYGLLPSYCKIWIITIYAYLQI